MKLNFWLELTLRIVAIFAFYMLISFIPEQPIARAFFGDVECKGDPYISCSNGIHWHWGYRHFLWVALGTILFIIQAIRVFQFIEKDDK